VPGKPGPPPPIASRDKHFWTQNPPEFDHFRVARQAVKERGCEEAVMTALGPKHQGPSEPRLQGSGSQFVFVRDVPRGLKPAAP
jgi:hypothetical protein